MKREIGKVIMWACILRFFMGPLRNFLTGISSVENIVKGYFIDPHSVMINWNFFLLCILYALLGYLVFYQFYQKKKISSIFFSLVIGIVLIVGFRYYYEEILLFNLFNKRNYLEGTSFYYHFLDNLYYAILYTFLGIVVYLIQVSINTEKKLNELRNSELSFLKSQINPHFLFNNLNNIYSLVYQKSENALDSISKLSNMLRYSLYENENEIAVSKEWKYIEDYLSLESYRQRLTIAVKKKIDQEIMNLQIAPYLLIPFIENAIKHGVITDENYPLSIELIKSGNNLHYTVKNKIINKEKDKMGGIGLDNLRKRLKHSYQGKHVLKTKQEGTNFIANLILMDIC